MTILANGGRHQGRAGADSARLTAATAALLTALACLLGLAATPAAVAQQASTASQEASTGGLGEIVVSAERRVEKLQTTPIAISRSRSRAPIWRFKV